MNGDSNGNSNGNSNSNSDNDNDNDGDGSSSGGSSGSSGSSSGGSNGDDDGSYGNGGSGDGANNCDNINSNNGDSWDDDSANGGDNGGDNGNGGGDDDASGYQDAADDEVVVSNEDVYDGDAEYDPIDDFDIEVVRCLLCGKSGRLAGRPKPTFIVLTILRCFFFLYLHFLLLPIYAVRFVRKFVALGPGVLVQHVGRLQLHLCRRTRRQWTLGVRGCQALSGKLRGVFHLPGPPGMRRFR